MIGIQVPEVPFSTQRIELDGREYVLRLQWNQRASFWYLGLSDQDDVVIFHPRKVVADWDLMRQITDARRPPGAIVARDMTLQGLDPGFSELGRDKRVELVYYTGEELGRV